MLSGAGGGDVSLASCAAKSFLGEGGTPQGAVSQPRNFTDASLKVQGTLEVTKSNHTNCFCCASLPPLPLSLSPPPKDVMSLIGFRY